MSRIDHSNQSLPIGDQNPAENNRETETSSTKKTKEINQKYNSIAQSTDLSHVKNMKARAVKDRTNDPTINPLHRKIKP